jgi:hypothetical protein
MDKVLLDLNQGSQWKWSVTFPDGYLTTQVFKMQIRENESVDSSLLLDVTPYLSVNDNDLLVNVPSTVTSDLVFTKGFFDLFFKDDSDEWFKLFRGVVTLIPQVTVTEEDD